MTARYDNSGRRLCDTTGCSELATHYYKIYRPMVGCEKHAIESCRAGRSYGIFDLDKSIRLLREEEMWNDENY